MCLSNVGCVLFSSRTQRLDTASLLSQTSPALLAHTHSILVLPLHFSPRATGEGQRESLLVFG